jgi:hypothetical protein
MAEPIDSKIKKEWITQALGDVTFSPERKTTESDLMDEVVILLQGKNFFGDEIYTYVKLDLNGFRALRDAMINGTDFIPSDFGTVVAAGRGEPSKELRDEMRVQYKMIDVPKPGGGGAPANTGFAQPKFFSDDD